MQQNIIGAVDEVTTTMPPALLVSATYNSQKKSVVLKFYEPNSKKILLWTDNTGHKPYCYSKLDPEELKFLSDRKDVLELKKTEKIDLLKDRTINVTKIIVTDQLALKGLLYDKVTNMGIIDSKEFQNHISDWANLLNQPIPKIRRVSFDIEVESEIGRIPDAKIADKKITAVGFSGSDGLKQVFV